MRKVKKSKGITLIALVITIIVLLILAGVSIAMLRGDNNIITKARNAQQESAYKQAEEEVKIVLNGYQTEKYKDENVRLNEYLEAAKEKNEIDEYAENSEKETYTIEREGYIFEIDKESLEILSSTTIAENRGSTAGKNASTKNRTLSGATTGQNSKNPIIPKGFKAIDTDEAKWRYTSKEEKEVEGWNNGLVIEDVYNKNQFVWVPCGMEENDEIVGYKKWCNVTGVDATDTTTIDGVQYKAIPVTETTQIETYGGFYVARYEAGLENGTNSANTNNVYTQVPISRKGVKVWNYIDYTHSYVVAEKMVNDSSKYGDTKSGLITRTQWDTIMKWYQNSNIAIDETQDWGTYVNTDYNGTGYYFTCTGEGEANLTGWSYGNFTHVKNNKRYYIHETGCNKTGVKKNIVDLGGNLWEWTAERVNSGGNINTRGGCTHDLTTQYAVSSVNPKKPNEVLHSIGFRSVLYLQ